MKSKTVRIPNLSLSRILWVVILGMGAGSLGAPSPSARPGVTYLHGMCDASAVVAVGQYQLVADDEDNILRVFDRTAGGSPVWTSDLSRFLRVDPAEPEVDIEAAARVGDRVYWISSHGRNRKGRTRPSRHRFFATRIVERDGVPQVETVGSPYMGLYLDMLQDPRLQPYGLAPAGRKAPKAEGALSIEGLAALPDGRLLIGFRNPIPFGKALIVPLENPDEVIAGGKTRFGDPVLLDLGGRGVRGMDYGMGRVIIAAGAFNDRSRPELFEWNPADHSVATLSGAVLSDLNPESIEVLEAAGDEPMLLVVSDDGTVRIDGKECKKLKQTSRKRFRTAVIPLGKNGSNAAHEFLDDEREVGISQANFGGGTISGLAAAE